MDSKAMATENIGQGETLAPDSEREFVAGALRAEAEAILRLIGHLGPEVSEAIDLCEIIAGHMDTEI